VVNWLRFCEQRKRKTRKRREDGRLYTELSEAMVCLEHICTEGCTEVGPLDVEVGRGREPCSKFATCQGLQNLIRHFATCERVKRRCLRCKRMWQLFRLHSSICLRHDSCKVPLCRSKVYLFLNIILYLQTNKHLNQFKLYNMKFIS